MASKLCQGDASEAREQHGWQYWASSVSDSSFRKTTMLTNRPASCHAQLRLLEVVDPPIAHHEPCFLKPFLLKHGVDCIAP